MRPPRLSPLPPDLALLLSPASVRLLLARFAPSSSPLPPLLAGLDADDPLSVAASLSFRFLPASLSDALADLTRVATPIGREAILERLLALPSSALAAAKGRDFLRLAPADLAACIVCAHGISKRDARAILKRALIRVSRHFAPRAWYTLLWPRKELPVRPESLLDAGRALYGADFVHGWIAGIEDGVLRAIVISRGAAERVATLTPEPAANGAPPARARARTTRPLACDVIRWDSRDGRVSFCLGRPALLTDWALAVGRACGDDPHAFSDRPAYTHKSLHEKGAPWVASLPLPNGVRSWDVIACEVDHDGKRFRARGDSALARIHENGARARGYMRATTLRLSIDDHDDPVDATIELPWKIVLSDSRFEEEMRQAMETLEMHAPGSLPDDLPSLAPMQPEWRWVDLLTQTLFARALEKKTLVRVRGKRPSGREHRRWGSLLRAFKMPGEDAEYVVGEEIAIRAFDAKPEALVWYAIDWARVAETLRTEMGYEETRVLDVPEGLLAIGETGAAAAKVIVFSLTRVLNEGEVMPLLKQLRRACGRATPALIVPRGRSLGGAVAEVEVRPGEQLGVEDVAHIAAKLAEECGLAGDEVEPGHFATEAAPLVLSIGRAEAWYGRVRLLLTENQLAMLFVLARAEGWINSTDLGRKIAPQADHPDQIVRKARLTLGEKLQASFDAAGVAMPPGLGEKLVEFARSSGYRLGVGAIVR